LDFIAAPFTIAPDPLTTDIGECNLKASGLLPETSAVAGTAAWFKVLSINTTGGSVHTGGRRIMLDGIITGLAGGGDIEFDDTVFLAGGTILINTIAIVVPQACPDGAFSASASYWIGFEP
jgi:hypothetical protein